MKSGNRRTPLGGHVNCRVPNQKTDNTPFRVRRSDPDADLATAGTKADASTHANEAGEVLFNVGLPFDGQGSVVPEACLDAADDWNGWQSLELQMGGKSLFRRYNQSLSSLRKDGGHDWK